MVKRHLAKGIVFLCCTLGYGFTAIAQPTLPDFATSIGNGTIQLLWICQYKGVKSITVLRSADGLSNFKEVGTVNNLDRGKQAFTDENPAIGKNCYKLGIVFASGLKWSSNSNCQTLDASNIAAAKELKTNNNNPTQNIVDVHKESAVQYPQPHPAAILPPQNATAPSPKKITLAPQTVEDNSSQLVQSRFLHVDGPTGNIIMNLPDEITTHHYSIKFFNDKDEMITEVPHITHAKIIMDKRNFQRRGIYKFNLRRDGVELEEGYLNIVP